MTPQSPGPAPTEVRAVGTDRTSPWKLLWLIPGGLALIAGLNAGLVLMGVPTPLSLARLAQVHGMLLVIGFVATLVSLERATAFGRWYGYIAPGLLALGAVLLMIEPLSIVAGKSVQVLGMLAFTLLYIPLYRRNHDATLLTQLLATELGLVGSIIWLAGGPMVQVLPWIIGFLVLTIGAERVELARVTMGPRAGFQILIAGAILTAIILVTMFLPQLGSVLLGLALLLLTAWLFTHDIARKTIRGSGVTRYMAASILAGYVWLTLAAALLTLGTLDDRDMYDAVIHAVFLGYTFSMIMAHAPTILPGVLRITLPYRPVFWVPVALLQAGLIVRIVFGDLVGDLTAWRVGGVLNVAAILVFAATAVTSAFMGPVKARPSRTPRRAKTSPRPEIP